MANDLVNTQPGRKGTNPWVVVVFLLAAIGGAAYLGLQDIDWKGKLASLTQPPVQPPAAQAPAPASIMAPSFDAVSADGGMLVAAGKAQPGATILLQSGGQTLGEAKADENGDWVVMQERALPAGPYELSVIAVDPNTQTRVAGRKSYALTVAPSNKKAQAPVQSAAATPNSAATASGAGAQQSKNQVPVAAVKPGDTLWAIAEHYFGKGMGTRYEEIAGANKDQIKNPNLIFPNQQFKIPENKAP